MKCRIFSIITALALCLSLFPTWAFAVEGEQDTGLCDHHRSHTAECGYAAPTEGHPCGHQHTEDCYTEETRCVHVHDETCYRDGLLPAEGEGKAADACVHGCSAESGCVTRTLDCHHSHDSECGYVQADPDTPCGYKCRICPIEDLIAALPEQVTEDNADGVRAQLDRILDLYRELNEDEQGQIDLSRVIELQEALDGANDPGNAFESDGFKPVSKLYVLGHEVVNGEVKSGEGWSFADNKLTLDNVNIQASDYPEGVTKFLDRDNNIAREYYLELYLKGNNTICGVAETGALSETRNIVLKVTGDPGATLTLNGQFQAELEISGSIGITINTQMPVFFDNGIIVDNGATVTLNCTGTNPSTGYSALSASPGEITIQNGSTLEINTTNPGHTFSLVGFGPLTVDNSTLTIKNAHSSGRALELRQYIFASYAETDTVTIRNSTVNLDAVRGLGGYAVEITDSTINTAERMSLALSSAAGEITVTNSTLNGLAASHFLDKTVPTQYTAYGKARLPSDLTIAAGDTLTVPEGTSLDIPSGVTLTNNGTMRIHGAASLPGAGTLAGTGVFLADVTEDLIHIPQPLYYTGESLMDQISLQDSLTAMEQVFTADTEGWQMTSPTQVVAAGNYTAVFEKANERMSKAFTVSRSGTEFTGEGTAKAYNQDGTETYSFAAGDTITVKAAPTPAGAAPTNSAMFAAIHSAPAASQTAVFVKDTQVSEAVSAGDGGVYTMTVPAADVLIYGQAGQDSKYTLIVKFVGNANMADAQTPVEITVTHNPLTADMVTLSAESATYNGTEQKPTVTVTGLTEGTHYDITYTGDFTNAGEHTLTVTGKGVYRGTVEKTYTIGKARPTIAWANDEMTLTYTGQPANVKPTVTLVNSETFNGTITYTYGEYSGPDRPTNAGDYTVQASIPEQGNYLAAKSSWMILYIDKANQAAPAAPIAEDANIKDTSITLTVIENAEYSMDGTTWQASPAFTGLNPNQTYTFYARLKEDANHNASPASTGKSIATKKTMLDNATVTASGSYTYNGSAQTPAVTVVKNGKTLTAGTDYTAAYANNTNAGTATVTITGMGSYEGTNSTTFTIQRKALTVAGAIAAGRPYNGTNTVTITGVTLSGTVDRDAVSVSTSSLTGTLNGTDAGNYTAVTLPALTLTGGAAGNYTLTRPAGAVSTSVTISKAAPLAPKTGDLAVANKQAHTYTFGLGALRPDLPAGMSFGSSAVTYTLDAVSLGSYYDSSADGAKIEGQTLTLPIEAVDNGKAEGIGTITVTIKSDNFEDMTATINVRSVNKIVPTGAPALSAATLIYGQPLSTIKLSGSMKDGSTDVPGAFTWSSPDNRPAVQEAYHAAWAFTPANNEKYAIVNGTSTIKVVPASVAGAVVTLSPTSFRYDGQAHSPTVTSVKLGDTTLTADTDYTVEIPTETAAGTYTVTVTGKGNYTGTAAATFTINPVETGGEFEDESGTILRLEVETGLSTVPEALENNARYDTPEKIETALRTQVEQVMSNVGGNIAVFDVTLQYKDAGGTWHNVDPDDFPAEGVTAILPYPDGTGATGYTFTIQHLISSGAQAGTMETLSYTLTADGLQCRFSSLSPVAIGYQAVTRPNPGGGSGGGGGSISTYAVTVEKSEHGRVTANRTNAGNGGTVTLTVTPDSGYALDTLTVTDSRGNEIRLTAQGSGKYTFTMPGRAVTVKAAFAPLPDGTACDGGEGCPSRGFTDLGSVGTWYHEAADYVLRNNLMGGYGNGTFGPNNTLTRAQFAQILFHKEGRPVVNYLLQFSDVPGEAWYTEAVRWAASQGIVGGYADGRFGPNDNITREQLAVMLWRYAGSPAATEEELRFTDADKVGAYARDAMRWAVENGVINGKGGGILDPMGLATRAQTAQMLKNFFDK